MARSVDGGTRRVAFLGSPGDPVLALLRSLDEGFSVCVTETLEAALEQGADVVLSAVPLDDAALERLEARSGVVVVGGGARPGDLVLPREPMSLPILELAIRAALDRRALRALETFDPRATLPPARDSVAGEPPGTGTERFPSGMGRETRRIFAEPAAAPHTDALNVRFQHLFESSPVGMALTSLDNRIVEANPALASMLGYEPEELRGIASQKLLPTAVTETTAKTVLSRLAGSGVGFITRSRSLVKKDGQVVDAEIWVSVVRDEGGRPFALLKTIVDVTEKRRAEESASQAHALLEAALKHMPAGVLLVERATGRALLANERSREILGIDLAQFATHEERIRGVRLFREDGSPYPDEERPLRRTLADGLPHEANVWYQRPDGQSIALGTRSEPIHYHGQEAAILVFQDVTALYDQARLKRSAEARYAALFQQASDAIFLTFVSPPSIVQVNPAAEKLFGYAPGELAGKVALDVLPKDQPGGASSQAIFTHGVELAQQAGVARFSCRGQKKDGRPIDLEIVLQPLRLVSSPDLLLVVARDVTQQRVLEEQLRQSQKLEAIGLLAGGIAHDFNNLLTGVVGFLELGIEQLGNEAGPTARARKFVGEARRAANRAVELTRQLLTFSRRSQPSPKLLDLSECLERTASMVKRVIGETIELGVTLAPEPCPIRGDAGELEQAIVNLAINARDAMPKGGKLKLETRRYEPGPDEAQALGLVAGSYVQLTITDNGLGMSDSVKARIFEPFFTTKEPGRGTGLGLAVVHGVIQRHGGRIAVDSAPGQGTTFNVFLPIAATSAIEAPLPAARAKSGPHVHHGTGRVLVVDDDPMVREVTGAMLETLGYKVSRAGSAAEALEVIAREPFDLVVSDVVMPDASGVELERRLRTEKPGLKVLLVSGYARDAFARHGLDESKVTALLPKPLTLESLGRKVHELLGSPPPGQGKQGS